MLAIQEKAGTAYFLADFKAVLVEYVARCCPLCICSAIKLSGVLDLLLWNISGQVFRVEERRQIHQLEMSRAYSRCELN